MKRSYAYAALLLVSMALLAIWLWKPVANPSKPTTRSSTDSSETSATVSESTRTDSSWAIGSRRVYRFDYTASGEYAMEGDAKNTGQLKMSLAGTIAATVVGAPDKSRTLEFVLNPERLDLEQMALAIPAAALKQELAQPFVATYDQDGAARAVAFSSKVGRQASTLLRDIVSQLQVTIRPGSNWMAVESEPGGECIVMLRRLPDQRIAKQKMHFVKVSRSGKLVEPADTVGVPTFERSEATYTVDPDGRVLNAVVHHVMLAKVEVVSGSAKSEVRASFTHLSSASQPRAQAPAPSVPLASRSLSDSVEDAPPVDGFQDLLPAPQVMANMRRTDASRDPAALHQAQHDLSRSIVRDPDAALAQLGKDDLNQPVLSAIGSAGTPAAQAALTRLATDPAQPLQVRKQAIDAFHEVPEATSSSVDRLLDLADKDPKVRENALLALGGLANRKGQTDPDTAAGWVDQIVARYQRATTDEERIQLLDALGNSGQEAAFPVLEAALTSGSAEVRIAATKNLRLMPAPRADKLLATLFSPDMDASVREAALFAASFRRFDAMHEALDAILRGDPNAELRMTALNALATYLQRDGAVAATPLIRWAAENDPDETVRQQAQRTLGG
jgi:HEAT repeat protein